MGSEGAVKTIRWAKWAALGSVALLSVALVASQAGEARLNLSQEARLEALSASYSSLAERLSRRRRAEPGEGEELRRQRLPTALIIGARKSGTRALLEFLNLHPNIRTARYEVHFFDDEAQFAKGLDWYVEQMPQAREADVVLEKTPGYFTSKAAPERVAALNKDMKLILILRDPLERTISDYTQVHHTKLSKNKTHLALSTLAFRADGSLDTDYKPVRNSLYVKHLRRWLRHFPRENLHIVDGDAFARAPLPSLRSVESFLSLPAAISPAQLHFNATKGFYCFRDRHGQPRCLGDTKGRPHVAVDPTVRDRLREGLRPYTKRFFHLARREFPDWLSQRRTEEKVVSEP